MKRIGVTGHRSIPEEAHAHVMAGIRAVLCGFDGSLEALSSLAVGADQLFADLALACGAELTVVIPSGDYEACFADGPELARYRSLKGRAAREVRLDFPHSTDEAYYAAGAYIADHCDRLLAVWDGRTAPRLRRHGRHRDVRPDARPPGDGDLARRSGARLTGCREPLRIRPGHYGGAVTSGVGRASRCAAGRRCARSRTPPGATAVR